jgi:hypothetical protein
MPYSIRERTKVRLEILLFENSRENEASNRKTKQYLTSLTKMSFAMGRTMAESSGTSPGTSMYTYIPGKSHKFSGHRTCNLDRAKRLFSFLTTEFHRSMD